MIDEDIANGITGMIVLGFVVSIAIFLAVCLTGCRLPAPQARALGYEFVYHAARSVKEADHLCAEVALERKDKKLADTCAHGYDTARHGLMAVEATLDGWKEGNDGRLGCAALGALRGIDELSGGLSSAGLPRPVELGHAATVAERISQYCDTVADGGEHVRD